MNDGNMIEITSETIERVDTLLSGIKNGANRAFFNAINRGLSRIRTTATKQVREVYAVKRSDLTAATTTKLTKASTGNLAGYVSFSGYKLPLYKFNVTPKKPGTGKQVTASVMKDGGTPFEDAFIAKMKNGMGVFERTGNKRLPVEEIMGLSAAQMVGNAAVIEELEKEAQKVVDERLSHEIDRILNGYGG